MISEKFNRKIYIADFTDYNNTQSNELIPFSGVVIGTIDNGILPSFELTNDNNVDLVVINNEKNKGFYKKSNGQQVSQCECIIHTDRQDNKKGWIIFVELKYCAAKNIYDNMINGISQLKATCNYVIKEKELYNPSRFKKYLVISTPGVEPLDPFDASYFDQDFILTIKEETGAFLRAANIGHVLTPAIVMF